MNGGEGLLGGMDGAGRYWLLSIVYGVAALIAAVALVSQASKWASVESATS